MSPIEFLDTEGNPLQATERHGTLRIPPVGAVIEFETCQAKIESVIQFASGIDVVRVIARCKVVGPR
jgi:hypothetical protein